MLPPHDVSLKAKQWFDGRCPGRFEDLLVRCTAWGIVLKTPTIFLLSEPAWTDGGKLYYTGDGEPNIWFIHWLSGKVDIGYFMSLGRRLPYIGWERRYKLKIYKWERGSKHG